MPGTELKFTESLTSVLKMLWAIRNGSEKDFHRNGSLLLKELVRKRVEKVAKFEEYKVPDLQKYMFLASYLQNKGDASSVIAELEISDRTFYRLKKRHIKE